MANRCYVSEYVYNFIEVHLEVTRQVSPNTYISYVTSLKLLVRQVSKTLKKRPEKLEMKDLNFKTIRACMVELSQDKGWSSRTWNLRLAGVKSFFRYLSMEELIYLDLYRRVSLIPHRRPSKKLKHHISEDEIQPILASRRANKLIDLRDLTMIQFMFYTGFRVSEVISIKLTDLNWKNSGVVDVTVLGKGRKERTIPLGEKSVLENLKRYISISGFSAYLFPTQKGDKMGYDNARRIILKYFPKERSLDRITPHTFRHSAAINWLATGVETRTISIMLGHEDVKTTEVYLKALYSQMYDAVVNSGLSESRSEVFKTHFKTNVDFITSLNLKVAAAKHNLS